MIITGSMIKGVKPNKARVVKKGMVKNMPGCPNKEREYKSKKAEKTKLRIIINGRNCFAERTG